MSNSVSFVGRLGRDAESKDINGNKVIKFNVANNVGFGDKQATNWFNVDYWTKSDKILDYLKKGAQVNIGGELTLRAYKGKDGAEKTSADVRANFVELVGGKSEGAGAENNRPAAKSSKKATEESEEEMPF